MLGTLGSAKFPFSPAEPAAAKGSFLSQKGLLATSAARGQAASFPGRRSADLARLTAVQAQSVTLDAASGVAARRQAACDLQVGGVGVGGGALGAALGGARAPLPRQ